MNWIIAILATLSVQIKRFSDYRNSKKGSLLSWILDNIDELLYALIATVILMLVLMNDSLIVFLDNKYLGASALPIDAVKPILALIIGLGGGLILRGVMSLIKKKINKEKAK